MLPLNLMKLPDSPVLFRPEFDVSDPEITVLVPSLDEEITIEQFCDWCHEGFARAGVVGEILIIDSSTDRTPDIALTCGARVLRVPRNGLGNAYRDALPYIRAKYVLLGDADCTYDFRNLKDFYDKLRDGSQFVMGSRFKGQMEKNSMPLHHKYFGSPLTTLLADVLFGLRLTDIHCGMRGLTTNTLLSLDLKSEGWEYASEMIVNAVRRRIPIEEIPIVFLKDMDGRESHVKRQGWLTPFRAGWKTIETLLTNAADFFLIPPGISLSIIGSLLIVLLSLGPVKMANTTFTLNTMIAGLCLSGMGYICLSFGVFSRCFYDKTNATLNRWCLRLPFTRTTLSCFATALAGGGFFLSFLLRWANNERRVDASLETSSHLAVLGLTVIFASITTLVTMLLIRSLLNERRNS
jgi:glycosyltransferase involved in cell wall biosynthesis